MTEISIANSFLKFSAGHVVSVSFPFNDKNEQKTRPVVILSNNLFLNPNEYRAGQFICYGITSKNWNNNTIKIKDDDFISGKLDANPSFVMRGQIHTIELNESDKIYGRLNYEKYIEICNELNYLINITQEKYYDNE